jgi:hypothetical protein
MATTATFSTMLQEYFPLKMLSEELKRRNWMWQNIEKDESYKGGTYYVPFIGGEPSSLSFGSLTSSTDVSELTAVKGYENTLPELWGTLIFNEKDLTVHNDLEQSFLKILPGVVNNFMDRMSERVSLTCLNGNHIDKLAANGADGSVVVYHPERFSIGEKIYIKDSDTGAVAAYVTAIDMNTSDSTGTLTIKDARSAGANVNATAYTTAQSAKIYLPGADTSANVWNNVKDILLSAANGGASTVHNQTKTSYPYLQAKNISGAAITASNILGQLYSAYRVYRQVAKTNNPKVVMSYKHWANIATELETSKQASIMEKKASYGWTQVDLVGLEGPLSIVAIPDMDDSEIFFLDMSTWIFAGHDFFKRKRFDGSEYFKVRNTTGYQYLVDACLTGQLICKSPCSNAVIHSISY